MNLFTTIFPFRERSEWKNTVNSFRSENPETAKKSGAGLDDTYEPEWPHHLLDNNLIILLQTNLIVSTWNLILQFLIHKMCQIDLIKLIWPCISDYKVKDIDIKNRTYYFFDNLINIKNFDSNNIKIDEKLYKNILIYYIGYVTIKDSKYVKISSVNPLYFIFNKWMDTFKKLIEIRAKTKFLKNE